MAFRKIEEIPGVYTRDVVSSWDTLISSCSDLIDINEDSKWIFRGQSSVDWKLKSTFERANVNISQIEPWKYEAAILREFTRRAHHYISDLPRSNNVLEWFSLMRHYGAPCRLLDFTYSFYVAIYFALKNATDMNGIAAVWAINQEWLIDRFKIAFPGENRGNDFRFKNPSDFYEHFLGFKQPHDFVAPVNPFRMNQKLTAQQGLFLCPGNIAKPFMENLIEGKDKNQNILRIPLAYSLKTDTIRNLRRMNINSATLFPDLAGFAEYLSDWFFLPLEFDNKDLISAIKGRFPGDKEIKRKT